jgi:hypothetical protein
MLMSDLISKKQMVDKIEDLFLDKYEEKANSDLTGFFKIVYGDPLAGLCESYCFLSSEMCSGKDWVPVSFEYIRNNTASGAGICYNGDVLMRTYAGTMMYEGFEDISTDTYAYVPDLRDLMFQAKLKARGARFEHGENPENTVNAESAEFMTAYRCSEAILSVG